MQDVLASAGEARWNEQALSCSSNWAVELLHRQITVSVSEGCGSYGNVREELKMGGGRETSFWRVISAEPTPVSRL